MIYIIVCILAFSVIAVGIAVHYSSELRKQNEEIGRIAKRMTNVLS